MVDFLSQVGIVLMLMVKWWAIYAVAWVCAGIIYALLVHRRLWHPIVYCDMFRYKSLKINWTPFGTCVALICRLKFIVKAIRRGPIGRKIYRDKDACIATRIFEKRKRKS